MGQRRKGEQGPEPETENKQINKQQTTTTTINVQLLLFVSVTCVSISLLFGVNGGELTRLFTELLLASVSDLDSGLG